MPFPGAKRIDFKRTATISRGSRIHPGTVPGGFVNRSTLNLKTWGKKTHIILLPFSLGQCQGQVAQNPNYWIENKSQSLKIPPHFCGLKTATNARNPSWSASRKSVAE
jgi:hypothetical protein